MTLASQIAFVLSPTVTTMYNQITLFFFFFVVVLLISSECELGQVWTKLGLFYVPIMNLDWEELMGRAHLITIRKLWINIADYLINNNWQWGSQWLLLIVTWDSSIVIKKFLSLTLGVYSNISQQWCPNCNWRAVLLSCCGALAYCFIKSVLTHLTGLQMLFLMT